MTSPSRQILPRTIASTLLFVEGAVVLALGGWMVVFGFTHENREILPLLGVVLFAIAGGLGLIQCGRGYKAGKNYGKAPAVLANLIALGVVKYQAEAGLYYVAIPIAVLAVATLFTVLKIASQENKALARSNKRCTRCAHAFALPGGRGYDQAQARSAGQNLAGRERNSFRCSTAHQYNLLPAKHRPVRQATG